MRLHALVVPSSNGGKNCERTLRDDDVRDTVAENRAHLEPAVSIFERNGFTLDPSTCVPDRAGIGKEALVYR